MSKKTIVLADNSYTIRRIVELSFSEEQEIELITFETSHNLKEKLLELRPHVVLVDIKLPEFNGYSVCRFVQENDSLKHTRVFLLKGGFEPIDEAQLQGLNYVDIITKPFDSNALVGNIKKLLEEMPDAGTVGAGAAPAPQPEILPSSLPEPDDLPEIDTMPPADSDISFSDVKEEIDTDGLLADDFSPTPGAIPEDEILPSEEITQAQSSHERDTLSAPPPQDDIDNPFADEMPGGESLTEEELNIKRNIEIQEKELEIGSLTVEEINIKQQLERQAQAQQQPGADPFAPSESKDSDTSELFPEGTLDVSPPPPPPEGETLPSMPDPMPEPMPEPAVQDFGQDFGQPPAPEAGHGVAHDAMFGVEEESPDAPDFGAAEEQLFSEELDMPQVEYQPTTGGDELHHDAVSFSDDSWSTPAPPEFHEPEPPVPTPAPAPAPEPQFEPPLAPAAVEPDAADMFSTRKMDMGQMAPPAAEQPLVTEPAFPGEAEFPPEAPTPSSEDMFAEPPVMHIPPVAEQPPAAPAPPVMEEPPVVEEPMVMQEPVMHEPIMQEPVMEAPPAAAMPPAEPEVPTISDEVFADVYEVPPAQAAPEPETPTAQSMPGFPETPEPAVPDFHKQPTAPEEAFADFPDPPREEPVHQYEPEFNLGSASPAAPEPGVLPDMDEVAPEPELVPEPPKADPYAGVYVSPESEQRQEVADIFDPPAPKEEFAPEPQFQSEPQVTWDEPEMPSEPVTLEEPVVELTPEPPMAAAAPPPEPPAPEPAPEPASEPAPDLAIPAGVPQEEVLKKIEDKLTHAIKEMLWEIVPPLAEKIIKDEIESLKKETENAFK